MALLDLVKKAQSLGPADGQEASICSLEPLWLPLHSVEEDSTPPPNGHHFLRWRPVPSSSLHTIKVRIDSEEALSSQLDKFSDDGNPSTDAMDRLLRPYFEHVLNTNPKVLDSGKASVKQNKKTESVKNNEEKECEAKNEEEIVKNHAVKGKANGKKNKETESVKNNEEKECEAMSEEEILNKLVKSKAGVKKNKETESVENSEEKECEAKNEEEIVKKHAVKSEDRSLSFPKLLKQYCPKSGQKLVSSILRACISCKNWDAVKSILESYTIHGNTYPDFVANLIKHNDAFLLCMYMRNVTDSRFSDTLLILKYILKLSVRSGKGLAVVRNHWRQRAGLAISRLSGKGIVEGRNENSVDGGMKGNGIKSVLDKDDIERAVLLCLAVDHFQPFELCLHNLLAFGHDEAVLTSFFTHLEGAEVHKLLHYLEKWLEKYCSRHGSIFSSAMKKKDLWVPSLSDVLRWISVLLDVHMMRLVLSNDVHKNLRSMQLSVKGLVEVGHKCASLVGVLEHIRENSGLPDPNAPHENSDHVIEYLEI